VSSAETPETVLPSERNRGRRIRGFILGSWLAWVGLLVSAGLTYIAVRNVDFGDVWTGLRTSNYWWLIPALGALALTVGLKAVRWRYLFASETRPPLGAIVRSLLVGYFFNSILPARAGEAARVVALNRYAETPVAEGVGTVAVERAYDVLVLLLLLFVSTPWLPHVSWLHNAALLAAGIAGVLVLLVIVLAVFGARPVHFVLKPFRRLPMVSAEGIEHVADSLVQGLAALRRPRLMVAAFVLTTAGWLALALSTWFVLIGFHLHLPFGAALLLVIATNLAMVLPSSPSAVGVFEAAALVALRAYGVSSTDGLPSALVVHMLNFLPFVAVGLFLVRDTIKRRRNVEASVSPPAS
jgi:glycosyltransferase 2 family protein